MKPKNSTRGFSMVEVMIGLALGAVLIGGAVALVRSAFDVNDMTRLQTEMQQNARVGLNMIATDASQAGTGIPAGGIALPDGENTRSSNRICDNDGCHILLSAYEEQRIYAVTPGDGLGAVIDNVPTDVLTLVYRDPSLRLDLYSLVDITPSGNQIQLDPRSVAEANDPAIGVRENDVIILSNSNGNALGVVTGVDNDRLNFGNNDVLDVNQHSADFGNIASLANPGNPAGNYPPTRAFRVYIVSFYIDNSVPNRPRLMRQVNGHSPIPVAEYITNFQASYDIFDDQINAARSGLADAGGSPAQIHKVNIEITASTFRRAKLDGKLQHVTLRTSVSGRNLSFRDRFE